MGLGLSSDGWDLLPARLEKKFHVITFDNRGTGESDLPTRPYAMKALADDAAAVLDAVGLPTAHVFGISMGGMIAQELALRHPGRLRRLALGCTFDSWVKSAKGHPSVALDLVKLVTSKPGSMDLKKLGAILLSREYLDSPGAVEAFVRWRKGADSGRARKAWQQLWAVAGHSTRKRLGQIQATTLVMTGDADRIIPEQNTRNLAERIPHARLLVFAGAGHVFPLEREAETVRALEDHFLAGEQV